MTEVELKRGGTTIATANSAEEFWTNYIEK